MTVWRLLLALAGYVLRGRGRQPIYVCLDVWLPDGVQGTLDSRNLAVVEASALHLSQDRFVMVIAMPEGQPSGMVPAAPDRSTQGGPRCVAYDLGKGIPHPASEPMSKEVADWYVEFTDGQFDALQHQDGQWYLHIAKPPDVQVKAVQGRSSADTPDQ